MFAHTPLMDLTEDKSTKKSKLFHREDLVILNSDKILLPLVGVELSIHNLDAQLDKVKQYIFSKKRHQTDEVKMQIDVLINSLRDIIIWFRSTFGIEPNIDLIHAIIQSGFNPKNIDQINEQYEYFDIIKFNYIDNHIEWQFTRMPAHIKITCINLDDGNVIFSTR